MESSFTPARCPLDVPFYCFRDEMFGLRRLRRGISWRIGGGAKDYIGTALVRAGYSREACVTVSTKLNESKLADVVLNEDTG